MWKWLAIGGVAYWYFFIRGGCGSQGRTHIQIKDSGSSTWYSTSVCNNIATSFIQSLRNGGTEVMILAQER